MNQKLNVLLLEEALNLLAAARWTRSQDSSDGFLYILGEVLKTLGHESLIAQL